MAQSKVSAFRTLVWAHYRTHGRHGLPWRKTRNVYRVLVSEVMLQQTQVERVVPLYKNFLKKFPTARRLAAAPLSEVLRAWQGLGYNRRAKMLRAAAKALVLARSNLAIRELEALPGVGPYTARAVAAFAHNEDVVFVETNIRTAIIHHFFLRETKVKDADVEKVLAKALPKGKAREWYAALMDWGAHLKRQGAHLNAKSHGYAKQKAFKGSLREVRGALLRELAMQARSRKQLVALFNSSRREQTQKALTALEREGLVRRNKTYYTLADQ